MHNLIETQISPADVKAVFRDAASSRNTPTGLGRMFKGLRKDKIEIDDLQQSWKDDGFSDDTVNIERILAKHGFGPQEIRKVFANVFGKSDTDTGYEDPVASETIQKIAEYIKKAGISDEIAEFLSTEYKFNESMFYPGKVVIEDVRQIFSAIVHEERSARAELLKKQDITQLGRGKK